MVDVWEAVRTLLSVGGAATGGLALYFNRRDAARLRAASSPTATVLLNPNRGDDGWYVIKLTFENVSRSFILTEAKLERPFGGELCRRKDQGLREVADGSIGRMTNVNWRVDPPKTPGAAAGFAHLGMRLHSGRQPFVAILKLTGHYVAGLQEPVTIDCMGRVEMGGYASTHARKDDES